MTQLVELSNGEKLEFPDYMTEEQMHQAIQRNYPKPNAPMYSEESKGVSGIATDALGKALQTVYGIPAALLALPQEAYGASKQIITNPRRASQNILGGLGELGHEALNAPANIRDYLVRKDLLSQHSPNFRLSETILPREYNYAQALGRQGKQAGDTLLGDLPTMIASSPIAGKALSAFKELPLTKGMAARPLVQAKNLIKERNIGEIVIPKDILREAKDFLPKNLPTKKLLEKARRGDYNTLFTLQSDIGESGRSLLSSASGADRLHGMQANDLRGRLLNAMKSHLTKEGHEDIANLLTKGQKKYKTYNKITKPLYYGAVATTLGHNPLTSLYHKIVGALS